MTVFLRKATEFWNDESGAGAIEYGLIAALIAVAIIAALNAVGGELQNIFTEVSEELAKRP
jgi:pilus assembly protein Flp/PilA